MKVPRLNLHRYRGQWVALDPRTHRVIAHDITLQVAERDAVMRGTQKPLLLSVPKSDTFFVG